MMKTMSAGILLGVWSPSRWKVIFVPAFQPGLTLMVNTLSSFREEPSGWNTFRDIFIFFVQPANENKVRLHLLAPSFINSFF